jgi:hypothetical protein
VALTPTWVVSPRWGPAPHQEKAFQLALRERFVTLEDLARGHLLWHDYCTDHRLPYAYCLRCDRSPRPWRVQLDMRMCGWRLDADAIAGAIELTQPSARHGFQSSLVMSYLVDVVGIRSRTRARDLCWRLLELALACRPDAELAEIRGGGLVT